MCLDGGEDLTSSDARLARIMQEQERLDAMLRREQKRVRRAQRDRLRLQQHASVSFSDRHRGQCMHGPYIWRTR